MKLLLIASWITALQTYPQLTHGGLFDGYPSHKPVEQSRMSVAKSSPQSPSGCGNNENKGSCGEKFSGYPARKETNGDEISSSGSGGSQFTNYPAHKEMEQNGVSPVGFKPVDDDRQEKSYNENQISSGEVQNSQIQRHIYFHAAPPEPVIPKQRQLMAPVTRQKHYTIIFIDTSSLVKPSRKQQQITPAQNEEKTIVYILVKKPEEQTEQKAPATPITAPNKPEVYFIKYKEQMSEAAMEKQEKGGDAAYPAKQEPGDDAPYPAKHDSGPKRRRSIF